MDNPRQVQGATHLTYELWQMTQAATALEHLNAKDRPGAADETNAIIYNALLESALLHCRELIDVLIDDRGRDDIRLGHLGSQWRINAEDKAKLRAVQKLLNKHLAHLTWVRVDAAPEPWSYEDTIANVVRLYGEVLDDLRTQLQERDACDPGVVRTMALNVGLARREISSGWSGRHFTATTPLGETRAPTEAVIVSMPPPPPNTSAPEPPAD